MNTRASWSVCSVRYTGHMRDHISELLITEKALDKLGARKISADEIEQLPRNMHLVVRNPRGPDPSTRRLLVGRTDGGRFITIVLEQTVEQNTWLVITGWSSTETERKL